MFGFALNPAKKARKNATGALAEFYAHEPQPGNTPLDELKLLAVDVETTGLDPKKDLLLSIGWVAINGRAIDPSSAGEVILQQAPGSASVGQSATLHGLTDDMLAQGVTLEEGIATLLEALAGRVMLCHFARIETSFLGLACQQLYGADLQVPVVDTFAVERRHMEKMSTYPRGEDLRLPRVRQRYGLPVYPNHRAVTDALACAELYLAHIAHLNVQTLKNMQPSP